MYEFIAERDSNDIKQSKAYDSGVGTLIYSWRDKLLGGITGLGIDKNIKDLYTFIVMSYERGDEIYLFGFSRGAYTIRSLAGFIRNCGILKPEHLTLIDRAYELYRDRNDYTSPDSDLMVAFKHDYAAEEISKIKFIGVWDTVGSLGIPLPAYKLYNIERYKFHDVTLSSTVDYAYHALAVDERRKLFEPALWEVSEKILNGTVTSQVMEQRWFAGVHCNVGGGYADRGLSDLTLQWMIDKAKNTGLSFNTNLFESLQCNGRGELRDSYTFEYWFWKPVWREIHLKDTNTNQVIDDSVKQRFDSDSKYRPQNLKGIF